MAKTKTCHVGIWNSPTEYSAEFSVTVQGPIAVKQYDYRYQYAPYTFVEGTVFAAEIVEYCRFVRSDGLGFKSHNLPDFRYEDRSRLERGYCAIAILHPTEEDQLPWTVTAKLYQSDVELSDSSLEDSHEEPVNVSCSVSTWWVYLVVASAVVTAVAAAVVLVTACKRTDTNKA